MSSLAIRLRARRYGLRLPAAWRQPLTIAGIVIAAAWVLIAICAPLIAPADPLAQVFPASQAPSPDHLFGTDELGRDVRQKFTATFTHGAMTQAYIKALSTI